MLWNFYISTCLPTLEVMRTTCKPRDVTQLHVGMYEGHFTLYHSNMLTCGIWNGFIKHASYTVA